MLMQCATFLEELTSIFIFNSLFIGITGKYSNSSSLLIKDEWLKSWVGICNVWHEGTFGLKFQS